MRYLKEIDAALNAKLLQYRKEHFSVEVKPERHPVEDGQIVLSVTTNGTRWTSISLLREEVLKVIETLSRDDGGEWTYKPGDWRPVRTE